MYYSFTTSKIHATVGSKIVQFSTQSILICLIISGSLRLVSLVKMSEAAGIQILGPDNVAIRKFRLIVFSLSSLISMVLIQEIGNYEIIFYPDAEIFNVILHFTPQKTMAARVQSIWSILPYYKSEQYLYLPVLSKEKGEYPELWFILLFNTYHFYKRFLFVGRQCSTDDSAFALRAGDP